MDIHKRITDGGLGKVCRGGLVRPGLARAPPVTPTPGLAPGCEDGAGPMCDIGPATNDHSRNDDRDDLMLATRPVHVTSGT